MLFDLNKQSKFEIKPLPMIGGYHRQRFLQYSPEDTANFYNVRSKNGKDEFALYPAMGRAHINAYGTNQLVFNSEPRNIFKSISFAYVIEGNSVFKVDQNFNRTNIGTLETVAGPIYFAFLVVNTIVFACFVDEQKIYVFQENTNTFSPVTDQFAPGINTVNGVKTKPGFIAAFGNRIVVSVLNSSQFFLSAVNLLNASGVFDPAKCFTIAEQAVFAQEDGIIRQMGVLNNTLYIFTDYITGVWSNIPAVFSGTGVTFPWKKSSTYNWNFGIANSESLDINFGYMAFLARNSDGLLQFMASAGDIPKRISKKSIDTLLQEYSNRLGNNSPFLTANGNGFLYQYENTIFYRFSGGPYRGSGLLDQEANANAIEYSFEGDEWHRVIEHNGERNRIARHVYFANKHLVTVLNEGTIYEMSGQFYSNEIKNPNQSESSIAYLTYPFRYERITPILALLDYAEFETEYAEIDFVFGKSDLNFSTAPFQSAQFLIDENDASGAVYVVSDELDSNGQPIFILANGSNTPSLNDKTYNALYKPTIELYFSDDGGISFLSADQREFSQQGVYQWRMRWYQLGASRNRVYKLICVSTVPIVILGAVMNVRRISGGAN